MPNHVKCSRILFCLALLPSTALNWFESSCLCAEEIRNQIQWVLIPSGSFLMGGQVEAEKVAADFHQYGRSPDYFRDEYPQHVVEITRPFYMTETEVTVGQFRAFTEATNYQTDAQKDGEGGWGYDKSLAKCIGRDRRFTWLDAGYQQSDKHPVVNVTWDDCIAYCAWLSKQEQRLVRLPTEAEWEYACRAGTREYYSMGNTQESLLKGSRTIAPSKCSIRQAVQDLEITEFQSNAFPVSVASYAKNAFGLYDMHGNVWEWTSDWHDENYYTQSPVRDPVGPHQGVVKVRRGGGWNTFPLWARASFRNWNSPDSRCINLGFRVVGELSSRELAQGAGD